MDSEEQNELFHIHNMDRYIERLVHTMYHGELVDTENIDDLVSETLRLKTIYETKYRIRLKLFCNEFSENN